MAAITRTLELPYGQEEVFDFLADLRNELAWHPEVESVELDEGGSVGPGATFVARYRGHRPGRRDVVEYQRPWHVVVPRDRPRRPRRTTTAWARTTGGTILETTAETPLSGLAWLLFPLLRGRVQRQFQERGEPDREGPRGAPHGAAART